MNPSPKSSQPENEASTPDFVMRRRCLDARGQPARRGEERRNTVDADVEQRAAAHVRSPAMVVAAIERAGERGPGEAQGAEAARGDERRDRLGSRVKRRHVRLEQRHAGRGTHAAAIASASAALGARGFSQSTCLPASAARSTHSRCRLFGRGRRRPRPRGRRAGRA